MKLSRIDLVILGERNYPHAFVKLPAEAVADFPELLTRAQELNPIATPDDVVRAIWRYGTSMLAERLREGRRVELRELPQTQHPVVALNTELLGDSVDAIEEAANAFDRPPIRTRKPLRSD